MRCACIIHKKDSTVDLCILTRLNRTTSIISKMDYSHRGLELKAVIKTKRGVGHIIVDDIEIPKVEPDSVVVEVKAAGICGTDIHISHDRSVYNPPVVLGHEYAGVVVEIGNNVEGFNIGDHVTSPATVPCGECSMCWTGHQNRCTSDNKLILGVSKADGAFAKFMRVPAKIAHKIPTKVAFEDAALSEPTACVVHAVAERVGVDVGDVVVFLGPGPMGLLGLQIAKAQGAEHVIITGTSADKERLQLAKKLGADITINIEEEDPLEIIQSVTNGLGADVVFETAGADAARRQALQLIRQTGTIGFIGITGGLTNEIDLDQILEKELDVRGSWGTVWSSWKRTLSLIASQQIKTAPLITARLGLDEWAKGFKMMEDRSAIKVLLIP